MIRLSALANTHRPRKKVQRVGRGIGSGRGKTCKRGVKGDKARMGFKYHFGREGGQKPLYRTLPTRGFNSKRFQSEWVVINLNVIDRSFKDGDVVNLQSLYEKKLAPKRIDGGVKILGQGELSKKVSIEAHAFSASAKSQLEKKGISFRVLDL